MILVRSGYTGRVVESALLEAEIPYRFIGGMKLLESAHIKDLISVLRLVANPLDEIAAMRYLTLWPGIGEVRATKLLNMIFDEPNFDNVPDVLVKEGGLTKEAAEVISIVNKLKGSVAEAFNAAAHKMESVLAMRYKNKEWDKRRRDLKLVAKLAEKHSSILSFIEEYLLDPLHGSQIGTEGIDDVVTVITIHSAKGTECETCYVINVSPGAYPSGMAETEDEVEEERRVLYVAMTRAKDELIITRRELTTWGQSRGEEQGESYFLNELPDDLFEEHVYRRSDFYEKTKPPVAKRPASMGITVLPNGRNV